MSKISEIQKFNNWNEVKKTTSLYPKRPTVKRGQVWWTKYGKNVGVELFGKHANFSRPVIVLKAVEGGNNAVCLPLTSKNHIGSWYSHFKLKDREEIAVFPQIKSVDLARFISKVGEIPEKEVFRIIEDFTDYLSS